ncbi:MAG: transcription termination/antitermination protein NusA [Chloroflexi bacterium]|nr:transcription termination/antitermination protein NusA [Chloroflexota bacterium]
MKSEFEIAITQLSSDRNLAPSIIIDAIEKALASAYKRNFDSEQNVIVKLDVHTGAATVLVQKLVVEEVTDPDTQLTPDEAAQFKANAKVGDVIDFEMTPKNFGRIAAQTAKQVIMSKIRDAERDSVYLEYQDRAGEIVTGIIRNIDTHTRMVTVSLGKAEALMDVSEQIPGEHYRFNQRLKVYLVEVERGTGQGPQITVSRTHKGLLRRLLEMEVPEIFNGAVEIKSIAREPGSRSKVAVTGLQPNIDPVGSCVGPRGVRIQNIVNELNGEKIDVVAWSADMGIYISNALSPAKVTTVYLNESEKTAKVVVPDRSLSLAIGKEGQNARLAAKLTGWRIDIRSETEAAEDQEQLEAEAAQAAALAQEAQAAREAAAALLAEANASLDEEEELEAATDELALEDGIAGEAEELEQDVEELYPLEPALTPADEAAEMAEVVSEPELVTEPAVQEPEEVEEEEFSEIVEDDEQPRASQRGGKRDRSKSRTLVFDERLGRVISKKRRKPGRSSGWDYDDEE